MVDSLALTPQRSWQPALRAALGDPKVLVGGGFILLLIVLALGADVIAPHDPLAQDLMLGSLPPVGMAGSEPGYWPIPVIFCSPTSSTVSGERLPCHPCRGKGWKNSQSAQINYLTVQLLNS